MRETRSTRSWPAPPSPQCSRRCASQAGPVRRRHRRQRGGLPGARARCRHRLRLAHRLRVRPRPPPPTPLASALQALTLLIEQRLILEVARLAPRPTSGSSRRCARSRSPPPTSATARSSSHAPVRRRATGSSGPIPSSPSRTVPVAPRHHIPPHRLASKETRSISIATARRDPDPPPDQRTPRRCRPSRAEQAVADLLIALGPTPPTNTSWTRRAGSPAPTPSSSRHGRSTRRRSRTTRATTSSSWPATSRSTRCANTTFCRSTASPTSATSRRPDPRTVQAGPGRRAVRPTAAGAGAAHQADRRLAAGRARTQGRRRRARAEHLCMSLRGVHASGSRTVTSTLHGVLREDPRSRAEFFVDRSGPLTATTLIADER